MESFGSTRGDARIAVLRRASELLAVALTVTLAWSVLASASAVAPDECAECGGQASTYEATFHYADPNVVWFETFAGTFSGTCVWDEFNCCVASDQQGCGAVASGYWQRNPPLGATSRTYSAVAVAKCGESSSASDGDIVGKLTVFANCASCPDCD